MPCLPDRTAPHGFATLRALCAAALAGAAGAHAQTITTAAIAGPAAATPVPAGGAWMLAFLACALSAAAAWAIGSGRGQRAVRCVCVLGGLGCGVMAAGYNSSVQAQLAPWMLSFTQAAGETLGIPLLPDPGAGPPADFRPVVFSNASGRRLRVVGLTGPAGPGSCFPSGVPARLPATPLPAGARACTVDQQLDPGAGCAVDVAAMCAQAVASAPPVPTLSQVSHPRCDASGKIFTLLEGTGLASVSAVTFGGVAAPSVQALGDTRLQAELPSAWRGGSTDVVVTTGYGSAWHAQNFDVAMGRLFCAEGTQPGTYQVFRPVTNAQTNWLTSLCLLCSIVNPFNAVDGDYDNYSLLTAPEGAGSGSLQQVLISPMTLAAGGRAGVIVSFTDLSPEDVVQAGAVELATRHGPGLDPNNRQRPDLHRLVGDSGRALLSLPSSQPFDRVEVRLRAGVISSMLRLRVYVGLVQVSP